MLPAGTRLVLDDELLENCSASDCAIMRARMSIAWPAAKPTVSRTGWAG